MDNLSAPSGKAQKYARIERERRWLLGGPPDPAAAVAELEITDVYFEGTRLRLRRMVDPRGESPTVYKLTQKVPGPGAATGLITNTYLSEAEYDLLSQLEGRLLQKVRYSVPPFGVDVFHAPLDGLVLAECEFDSDETMAAASPPSGAIAEVTSDGRFTGGQLVSTGRAEVVDLLAEFGVTAG